MPRLRGSAPRELGYAEITSNATTTATSVTDVTGLSVDVTVGSRAIVVEFACRGLANSAANGNALVSLREGATALAMADLISAPAGLRVAVACRRRLAASPGAHTYKVQWLVSSGTATMYAGADHPAYIRVYEV